VCLFLFCVTHARAYQDILKEGLLKHKFTYPHTQKKMTSTTTISTIVIEPEALQSTVLTEKEKFAKRFQPTNLKPNNQSNKKKRSPLPSTNIQTLRAEDIKEHRWWSIISLIFCFCIIAPCIAFYHSRRIREMKNNQELTRAKIWSDRVGNMLIISTIIGIILWIAVIFVIAVLFILGAVY